MSATDLAWYAAGLPVSAGVYGTSWWPGGAIVGDAALTTLSISAGTPTLTRSTGSFTSDMVGRIVKVNGAGNAGSVLETTISAFGSATSVTLGSNASTAVVSTGTGTVLGELPNNKLLAGAIPASNLWSKTPIYTNIYLKNVHATRTYNTIYVGLSRLSGNQNTSITVAKSSLGVSVSEATRTNANLTTAPVGVTFASFANLPNLTPGQFQSIWIKHAPLSSTLSASSLTEAGFALSFSAKY